MIRLRHSTLALAPMDAQALVTTLAWLRPCAALGQALAIAAAIAWLRIALPLTPLIAGIAVLVLATPLAFWRLRQAWPVGALEAVGHVAFDLLLLGWALYFTGGASNPFITLLLVPVALAAMALPVVGTGCVVALALVAYAALIFFHVPLPDMSLQGGAGFQLHLTGMAINFVIAIALLAVLIGRMTASLRVQREATRQLRERVLRDEGILAIATQAAEAAHELNTPLASLRMLLPELAREHADAAALGADVKLMLGEVERCRTILKRMVDYGRHQLSHAEETLALDAYVRANVERFRLLCPDAEVRVNLASDLPAQAISVQPGLAHALLNLMQNAYDASVQNASRSVTLEASTHDGRVEFVIGDRGTGLPDEGLKGLPATSAKPDGLGMGLALARSTIERLRGGMHARHDDNGTRVHVWIPLAGSTKP